MKGQQCSVIGTNGIAACQCNFMEAYDAQGNSNPNLAQYLPTGVDQLGLVEQGQRNLAYLCEGGDAVGILYDCNNRIPLYAATVINGAQLTGKSLGGRPKIKFSQSSLSIKDTIGDYRVNVPRDMWTAACCTYSDKGKLRYRSTAFWRENNPGNAPCNRADVGFLTRWLSGWIAGGTVSFNLFPQTSQCNIIGNYIPLP